MLVVLDVLAAGLEGVGVGLMVPLLNGLTDTRAAATGNRVLDNLAAPFSKLPPDQMLPAFLLAIIGIVFLKSCIGYARQGMNERLRIRLDRGLQVRVMDQLLSVGYRYICERRSGDLLSHFNDHVPRTGIACRALLSQVSLVMMILVLKITSNNQKIYFLNQKYQTGVKRNLVHPFIDRYSLSVASCLLRLYCCFMLRKVYYN